MARSRTRIDPTPFQLCIDDLSHDGRGVARREGVGGKVTFVSGALPGETVLVQQTAKNRHFDQARTLQVIHPAKDRITPRCAHFGTCAGCVLQHMEAKAQIAAKEQVLLDNLERIGHVRAAAVLPALTSKVWGYRRKGRLSVRRVEKKGKTLLGFREHDPRFVADINQCLTIIPQLGNTLPVLAEFIDTLQGRSAIPQIEFVAGDKATALTVRHLQPLSDTDQQAWRTFAQQHHFAIYLQSGGANSVQPLWPPQGADLAFTLPQWQLELKFAPLDFIQVNAELNQKMIAQALHLLDAQAEDRVLDLFCGLGNFSLPLAKCVREVVGVEGDSGLVSRARNNAQHNWLENVQFFSADLTQDQRHAPWMRQGFDRLLLDPPRSGALEVLQQLPLRSFQRIVYVSCHPASLARDAAWLVNEQGFKLSSAGVMDMFPHTAHVESIAVFDKGLRK